MTKEVRSRKTRARGRILVNPLEYVLQLVAQVPVLRYTRRSTIREKNRWNLRRATPDDVVLRSKFCCSRQAAVFFHLRKANEWGSVV